MMSEKLGDSASLLFEYNCFEYDYGQKKSIKSQLSQQNQAKHSLPLHITKLSNFCQAMDGLAKRDIQDALFNFWTIT